MKPRLLVLMALGMATLSAQILAQSAPSLALAPPATEAPASSSAVRQTHVYRLSNGMALWVRPDHRAPTAVHMVWLRVGSMDEVDGTSGVAHALEHMMFKGTTTLAPGEFSRRVAALGGRENAFTSRDYTGYFQQIPADRLAEVMALESDRLAHNQWPDAEFAREIEVVKEERRMRTEDNPRALLHEALMATALSASPYRRPIVGWMSDLEAMTAQDVRDFYRRWYTPANAVVIVAGDVQPEQVRALAEQHYGRLRSAPVPTRKPQDEPVQKGLRRVELKAPAEQSYVALAYRVPRLVSLEPGPQRDDALALTVLAAVLDGYSGARLERQLAQGTQRLADSVGADNGLMGRGPQFFMLEGVPAPGVAPQVLEDALRAQVRQIAEQGIHEAELRRVKTQWVAAEVYKLDSVFNQARELGVAWALDMPADSHRQLMALLSEVTAEQVQSVARRYFDEDGLTVATLRPQPRAAVPQASRPPLPGLRH